MDPFSIATRLAGLISLTSDFAWILTDYTGGVKSATKDARSVLTEVTALSHVLQQLIEFLQKDDTNSKCRFRATSALCSVIAICKNHIETLYRKVKFQGKPEKDLLSRLKLPFEKQECQEIVEVLHRCSQTFTFSLQIANCELLSQTSTEVVTRLDEEKEKLDSIASMFPTVPTEMKDMRNTLEDIRTFVSIKVTSELEKISISVEGLEKRLQDDQRMKILDWLSPLQPQKRYQDVRSLRLNNTGGWLLNDKRFTTWCTKGQRLEPKDRILCCYGMPGAGKTIMCSAVIDFLHEDMQHLPKGTVGIACFYCDYRDQTTQKGPQIIGSLVVQFLAGLPEVSANIVKTFMDAQENHTRLELRQGLSMLESLVTTYDNSFLCINAIDELEVETQQALLQAMQELLSSRGGQKIRVLFTGRPHIKPHVLQHFKKAASSTDREIEIVASEDDISCFLSHHIETKDPIPDRSAMNDELRCKIITTITKKSGGMFLLPALHIQAILEEPTIGDREDALDRLPDKLHGAFEKTISRIGSQPHTRAAQGMMVLTWVFLAKRPLSLEELRHALAVRTEVEMPKVFDAKRLCSRDILLGSSLGLVIVDDETSTVRLVHYSLQEFLERRAKEIPIEPGHTSIARICLKYLHFYRLELTNRHGSRNCTGPSSCSCQKEYPLLDYAATEWGHHTRDSSDSSIHTLATNWLRTDGGSDMCAFRLLSKKQCQGRPNCLSDLLADDVYHCNLTTLHHAAYFGEPAIFEELYNHLKSSLTNTVDLNTKDAHDWTPLTWAVARGHTALVTLFSSYDESELDADPSCDAFGRTPLSYAATEGNAEIVACLLALAPRVNPDHRDRSGWTPLSLSAKNGHADVVRLLMDQVDPNSLDPMGNTPLCAAIQSDRVHQKDGKTPLHLATSEDCDTKIAEIMLQCTRVDPNLPRKDGKTPLQLAILNRRLSIRQLLLQNHRIDPNLKDTDGRTPLHSAVFNKDPEVIQCLLRDPRVDPNLHDTDGRTPLHSAVNKRYLKGIEFLLHDPRVDPNLRNKIGRTPLHSAVNKDPEVSQCLLRDPRVDPNLQGTDGRTPLHSAVVTKDPEVIQCLLQDPRVDPNLQDTNGQSPLHIAVFTKDPEVIQCLLRDPRVDPNLQGTDGRTPLHSSVVNNDPEVIQCLLRDPRVDPNLQDTDGETPLHFAAAEGPEEIQCLLRDPRVDPNIGNYDGFLPLMLVVLRYTRVDIHKLITNLLSGPRVSLEAKDNYGRTALSHAAGTTLAFEFKPQSLEPSNEFPPSASTRSVTRRRCRALEDRQTYILQALLRNGADPHTRDDQGRSPLDWAMSLGDLKSPSCIDLLQKYMSGELTPTAVAGRKRKTATPRGAEPSGKRLALESESLGQTTIAYGHGQNRHSD